MAQAQTKTKETAARCKSATSRRTKTKDPSKPDATFHQVSEDYRNGIKESLKESFEHFLNNASREELSFMEAVMEMGQQHEFQQR